MKDDLETAARAERQAIHEFVVERLAPIYAAGGDPEPIAVALLGQAAGLMLVLKGPAGAAEGLREMADQIGNMNGLAGNT